MKNITVGHNEVPHRDENETAVNTWNINDGTENVDADNEIFISEQHIKTAGMDAIINFNKVDVRLPNSNNDEEKFEIITVEVHSNVISSAEKKDHNDAVVYCTDDNDVVCNRRDCDDDEEQNFFRNEADDNDTDKE